MIDRKRETDAICYCDVCGGVTEVPSNKKDVIKKCNKNVYRYNFNYCYINICDDCIDKVINVLEQFKKKGD